MSLRRLVLLVVVSIIVALLSATTGFAKTHEVLIDGNVARKYHLKVGDTIYLSGDPNFNKYYSFKVSGIYKRKSLNPVDNTEGLTIHLKLSDLQELAGIRDQVDNFRLKVTDPNKTASVVRQLNHSNYDLKAFSYLQYDKQLSSLNLGVASFYQALGIITVFVALFFMICVQVIVVSERKREIGIMRAIGLSKKTIFQKFLLESVVLGSLGIGLGLVFGLIAAYGVNYIARSIYDVNFSYVDLSVTLLYQVAIIGIVVIPLASLYPAWKASRTNIIDSLRQ